MHPVAKPQVTVHAEFGAVQATLGEGMTRTFGNCPGPFGMGSSSGLSPTRGEQFLADLAGLGVV